MSIKALWQILAIFTALILMIIFPVMNAFEKEDDLIRLQILDELDFFLSKVKQSGSISKRDYELFNQALNNLGYPFEVKINHYKQIYVPVYDDPQDFDSFTGEIQKVEELFSDKDIKGCLYPLNSGVEGKPYNMSKGDYITVAVKSKVKSKHQKLKSMLLGVSDMQVFYAKLGGLIQNEAY